MKKKISKLIAVLLSVVILLTNAIPAFATLTEGTKYSFTTKYLDAYYDTGTWQTADGHTHNNYGQVALRNLTSTGEPLYCLQIYNAVDSSAATADNIKDTEVWAKELTPAAQTGITRVSIYGYPNYTYGYSAQDAQLATQVLTWEFEIGRRAGYSTTHNSFETQIFENYSNARKCYEKILEACSNHYDKPSFSSQTITLKGTGSSNSVTITDTNGVLNQYSVKSTNDRIKVSSSGNNLTIYCTGTGALSGRIVLTKKCTDINSSFALTGANQTLFYGTIADPVSAPLSVELSLGSIKIIKTSEDGQIANKEFQITGNGVNQNVKTNSSGEATLNDLPEGKYTVTEMVDKQYKAQSAKTVTVSSGTTATVSFNNILTKGTITISKSGEIFSSVSYDDEAKIYQPIYNNVSLPGAVYEIYANEDIVSGNMKVKKGTLVDTVTTKTDGTASTKPLLLNADGTAEYRVIEKSAPDGYVLDTEQHIVTLTQSGANLDATAELKAKNERQKVKVEYTKALETDELFNIGMNDEISNVIFGLYAEEEITAADGTTIPEGALIEIMSFDEIKAISTDTESNENTDNQETANEEESVSEISSVFSVKTDLPFGSYYIQEIETDSHYILNDTKYHFDFSYTGQNEDCVNIQINGGEEIINTLKRGKIEGLKLDDNGEVLPGALIGLFSADAEEFTENTALMTTISADDGTFTFSNLTLGNYIVKEFSAPEDYLLDPNNYSVEITDNEQIVTLEIVNVLKRGSIEGIKTDNNGNSLEGALIGLFSADTGNFTLETAIETTTSSEDGSFSFSDIPVGSYIVKELEAPEGYILDNEEYKVTLTEEGQIVNVKIVNTLKIGKLTLEHKYGISPKTGAGNEIQAIALATAGTVSFVSAIVIKKRKKVQ